MKRRTFIQKSLVGTVLIGAGALPLQALDDAKKFIKLTILHTNDVHSRIEPFPMDGGKYQGLGGAARRAALINQIRREEKHVLLLDAGDIFQGTPYFNFFGGELEYKLMSAMQYDAATIGNHDFDAGIDMLQVQVSEQANFPLITCNYDFSDTLMNGYTKPYTIFQKGELRIGVLGVGIELKGLVTKELYSNTRYLNPVTQANKYATILKNDEKCDYVICLSHLGYQYDTSQISDVKLAAQSENIDLIIGGHTHTFMEEPVVILNKKGKEVIINQAGWAGIMLGRLDVYFEPSRQEKCLKCKNILVKAQT